MDKVLDINEIMEHLPHRYPFLLIDRVLEFVPNESLKGYKNVTYNEPFFAGHFPQKPIMPGVLIIEALAQATGLLAFRTMEKHADKNSLYYLVGIDKVRFKNIVEPGDRLDLEVKVTKVKRGIWLFKGVASVEGKVVTTADLMCTEREVET